MTGSVVLLFLGFGCLIGGAHFFIDGAQHVARKLGISDLVIGLTVVAFGTSLPEITVNLYNTANGLDEAAFGNVIGSNIFNVTLILGVAALINPVKVEQKLIIREIPFSLVIVAILMFMVNDHVWSSSENILGRVEALVLFLLFGIYFYGLIKNIDGSPDDQASSDRKTSTSVILMIAGLGLLIYGGQQVTKSAREVARYFGMSCLLYTSPSPRDQRGSRMPSSA